MTESPSPAELPSAASRESPAASADVVAAPATAAASDAAVASVRAAAPDAAAAPSPRVDFYVLDEVSPRARLRTACRVVEKAYLAGQTVLVWHTEVEELREFDELLWTFSDGSFVPHEPLAAGGFDEAPVLLSAGTPPPGAVDVLVNLAADVPPCAGLAQRVAEFIDGDPARRQAGRARFRAYKERGLQPATHNLRSDQPPG